MLVSRNPKYSSNELNVINENMLLQYMASKCLVHFVLTLYALRVIDLLFGLDIDLKKAAKFFGKRFATGSSVTKNPQGKDEIVIQGDVSDDIMDLISDKVDFLSVIPEDNVELVEEKKK